MSPHPRLLLTALLAAPFVLSAAMFGVSPQAAAGDGGIKLITQDKKHDPRPDDHKHKGPRIQLALLLDTSNSMDGLIHQAQAQLWKIVNELSACKKNGRTPKLEVALYEYGNTGLPADGGWVRQVLPFSDNLDDVSEKLFALNTNGGDEYCGRVIEAATRGLTWRSDDDSLKIIVIAGNEPFTQGPVDYKHACRNAKERRITVNTIFCGNRGEGVEGKWRHGAKLGGGEYSHIDQNSRVIEIETPHDDELAKLSIKINGTYLFYGKATIREHLRQNQAVQDSNAAGYGSGIAASRAATKAGENYSFEADLTARPLDEAAKTLNEAAPTALPKELRGKSLAEQKEIIKKKSKQRREIQRQIQELTQKRDAYIAEQHKKEAGDDKTQALDEALLGALREQARAAGFTVGK